mmetsp:Transcript_17171/g.12277  ORF Transcript_17171/g.12277 Transcript_17171/m.12277 type:complete len:210 (+) Transcript_17171:240-869(+)
MPVTYTRQVICPHCRGSGADNPEDVEICPKCNGQGQVIEKQQIMPGFVQQVQKTCPKCGGKGKKVTSTCHVCGGNKIVRSMDEVLLFIEKGIPDGKEYTYREAADENVDMRSGDVVFRVETLQHAFFTREGNNLKCNVKITLKQALLGFSKEIKHLDGHLIRLKRDKITRPGEVEKILGEGMPIYEYPSDYGDLFVTFVVEFPKELVPE